MFEDVFNDWAWRSLESREPSVWRPAADVFEKDGSLTLRLELAGILEKDVQIKVEGSVLTISGSKKYPEGTDSSKFHQIESFYGDFSRSFSLPDSVDLDQISARFKEGVLVINLPQKPETKPRTIKVC